MRVLFAYNGPIKKDKLGNFYGNELNDKLIERYKNLGKEVTFLLRVRLVSDEESKKMTLITSSDFKVIEVPQFNSIWELLVNFKKINKVISNAFENNDLLVARLPSYIARVAIDKTLKLGKPYLVEVVGCPWDALRFHGMFGKLIAPIAFLRMRYYTRIAPFVIYVTKSFLQDRYPNVGINQGISDVILPDLEYSILEQRINKLNKRDFRERPLRVGTVGSYSAGYKGQDFGIRLIAKLKEKGFHCFYIIVGSGDNKKLRKLAENLGVPDRIEFLGEISHSKIFAYLDEIDIYIQPSKQDGLPRALVEAMSRGCSCWGTRIGGIPELIDNSRIFSTYNFNELADRFSQVTTSTLIKDAVRNFEIAKEYSNSKLDVVRTSFFAKFKASFAS